MFARHQLTGQWYQLKGTVKRLWGRALGDAVLELEGDYDVFIGLVRKRQGDQAAGRRLVQKSAP